MPNTNERDALIAAERSPQDYALEHAGYLVAAAERFIAAVCVDAQAAIDHDEQDTMETAKAADKAREDAGEYMTSLRAAIHEFRVRRNRALAATAPNAEVPTGAIVNGRTYIERIEQEGFECEAGNIQMCTDWQELRRCFETLADWAMHTAPNAGAPLDGRVQELESVLHAVNQQFEKHGNSLRLPDEFDGRVFTWVRDALAAAPAQQAGAPASSALGEGSGT